MLDFMVDSLAVDRVVHNKSIVAEGAGLPPLPTLS